MTPLIQDLVVGPQPLRDPRYLRGMEAWYDASDFASMVMDSANRVSLIADKSGKSGVNCLVLNGADGNAANVSALAAIPNAGAFSVSARIGVASTGSTALLFGAATTGFGLKLNTNGTLQATWRNLADVDASTGTVPVMTWVTVTYVRTGTTGTYYIDGVSAGSATDAYSYDVGTDAIGSNGTGNGSVLAGNIQWARVYSAALSPSEVTADAAGSVQSNCVLDVDFTLQARLATSFSSGSRGGASPATITINTSGATGARICGERDLYQGTVANQPVYLPWTGQNYGYLNGASGNYFSAPDSAALDVTGDLDIRLDLAADDWTPSVDMGLVSKYEVAGASYLLRLEATTGNLRLFWVQADATAINKTSTAAPSFQDGKRGWVRVTLDVDNGASGNDVKFWTSTDGVSWAQLGSTVTTAGVTNIRAQASALLIGAAGTDEFAGRIYRAQIYNGIAGTLAFDFNASAYVSGTTLLDQSSNGATITLNGGAAIVTRSCLYFDGSNDYLASPLGLTGNALSVCAVSARSGLAIYENIYGRIASIAPSTGPDYDSTGGFLMMYFRTAPSLTAYRNSAAIASTDLPEPGAINVSLGILNNDTGSIRLNRGVPVSGATSATPMASAKFGIGAEVGTLVENAYLGGMIHEEAIYSQALTPDQQARFINYTIKKWGIAAA